LISYHPVHPSFKDGGQFTISRISGNYNCRQAGGLIVAHHQPRALDLASRNTRKLEGVPTTIMDEVVAKLATIFE
jgi:hypothetical protein